MRTKNHCWLLYPNLLENKIQKGSLSLYLDPSFAPEWHSVLHGIVHDVPETNDFGIQDKLQIGDKVFFKYIVADEENMLKEDGENYLRVPMNLIFCYVRDGVIIPYAGYVLAKSIFDDDVEQVEVEGKLIPAKLSKSGLVTNLDISFKENLSKIAYIGQPIEGEEDLGLVPGDVAIMESHNHHRYTIEGVEYFVFHQSDIIAKLDHELQTT